MEEVLPAEPNQDVKEDVKEHKQRHITVLSEEDEKYLSNGARVLATNEARVCSKKEIHTHFEEEIVSRKKIMKVVEFSSVTHQGKVMKMLGEIGAVWRPKTRPKNKLRLNMKKLLNPKLAKEQVTAIEDSSSQEELDGSEDDSKEVMKDKKPKGLKNKSVFIDTKISDIFMEIRNQMIQE